MSDVAVVIPAGGSGKRMRGGVPKQFLRLGGVPVLQRTIAAFHSLREITEIVLVVPAAYIKRTHALVRRANFTKVHGIVKGGAERQDSVRNGLMACTLNTGLVLVHDAVRPLVSSAVIRSVISAAKIHGAAVTAVRVKDTIKLEEPETGGFFERTLPREALWGVQTPQGFRFDLLWAAHEDALAAGFRGTDEASLVERMGVRVKIVEGEDRNIKITTPTDRKVAELLLKR